MTYDDSIAERYDAWFPDVDPQMIERLVELLAGGRALELGIGTGRVALPLRARGIEIQGIDSSQAMVDRLQAKAHGQRLPVTIGSFAEFEMEDRFDLVFGVFNTFFALLTQQEQVSSFRCVSKVLADGGRFLIEAFLPDLERFDRGQTLRTQHIAGDHVRIECSQHDRFSQTVTSRILKLSPQGIEIVPIKVRYAWPAELDLMADLAGLKLLDRWGGWRKEELTNESASHVSVYGR